MNKINYILSGAAVLLSASGVQAQSTDTSRPNVIYVFPDQFRNCALEFWNQKEFNEHGIPLHSLTCLFELTGFN